jgi:hypothetical protein
MPSIACVTRIPATFAFGPAILAGGPFAAATPGSAVDAGSATSPAAPTAAASADVADAAPTVPAPAADPLAPRMIHHADTNLGSAYHRSALCR